MVNQDCISALVIKLTHNAGSLCTNAQMHTHGIMHKTCVGIGYAHEPGNMAAEHVADNTTVIKQKQILHHGHEAIGHACKIEH